MLTGKLDRAVVWLDVNYTGEELGTETKPYNTLSEAVAAVDSGGMIKIKGDIATITEPIRITKPVRIEAG